jgi:uncharacterized protein (TIGR02246 family)
MSRFRAYAWLSLLLASGSTCNAQTPEMAIRKVLDIQVQAWNRGDLKTFTDYYSEDALFVGKTPIRGRLKIFEMYRRAYPTAERRGSLEFTISEVRMLGRDYASVVGRYHLTHAARPAQDAAGIFSLLFHLELRATPPGWQIILDHTS